MTLPDIDAIDNLGGELVNAWPVTNPTTDLDAAADNKSRADVAMMSHTATRGWCAFKTGNPPTDPTTNIHDAVWGDAVGVKPTVARTATGAYTVTFPATVDDELGVSHSVNIRRAWATVDNAALDASTIYFPMVTIMSAVQIKVNILNTVGTTGPIDTTGVTVTVFIV